MIISETSTDKRNTTRNTRWSQANVQYATWRCHNQGCIMVAFHAIPAEHFSEEQHKKKILKNASLKENAS